MSTISGTYSGSPTAPITSAAASSVPSTKTLGVNDFMKLLATQFQQQDPMKPMDDTAFIAQTAQFTGLQQTTTLVQQITQLAAGQDRVTANSYLGRQVTFDAGQGATVSGVVSAVDASGTAPQLIVNGKTFPLSAVLRVEPAPVSPNQPTTPSPTGGS